MMTTNAHAGIELVSSRASVAMCAMPIAHVTVSKARSYFLSLFDEIALWS
jgi:hypothetical protein